MNIEAARPKFWPAPGVFGGVYGRVFSDLHYPCALWSSRDARVLALGTGALHRLLFSFLSCTANFYFRVLEASTMTISSLENLCRVSLLRSLAPVEDDCGPSGLVAGRMRRVHSRENGKYDCAAADSILLLTVMPSRHRRISSRLVLRLVVPKRLAIGCQRGADVNSSRRPPAMTNRSRRGRSRLGRQRSATVGRQRQRCTTVGTMFGARGGSGVC